MGKDNNRGHSITHFQLFQPALIFNILLEDVLQSTFYSTAHRISQGILETFKKLTL